ncbi:MULTISPECIES: GNAT family N-acetyltransferase [unclassified Thiocapsa]|uniref:GNAT family N-acetyltransferase n=1 Tax=unclassified Thiocapsa TaxID=2641286 RepID=UPI0035B250D4
MLGDVIRTERLVLRPIGVEDLSVVQTAAGRREVADTMISIAHPFSAQDAERYVGSRVEAMQLGYGVAFTFRTHVPAVFVGFAELRDIEPEHALAELSFWLAVETRGRGYMAEALAAVLRYAFRDLDLNRVYAYHMVRNPTSGRVLSRLGFQVEGLLRQRVRKWGLYEDVVLQALLRSEWSDTVGPPG